MKKFKHVLATVILSTAVAVAVAAGTSAPDAQRQADVAKLGADVMPFSLKETTHIFTKTEDGGIQRVIVKESTNTKQLALVREHLRAIQQQFRNADYSSPTHIHGSAMPGLSELKAAMPGQMDIQYRDVDAGGELTYRSADKKLVSALHAWFDAQLSDHGSDAVKGNEHQHNHGSMVER